VINEIDFTPLWYRHRQVAIRARRKRLVYLSLLVLFMGSWFAMNEGRIKQVKAELTKIELHHEQTQSLYRGALNHKNEEDLLTDQLQRFKALAAHVPKHVILAELSHCLPEKVRIDRLQIENLSEYQFSRSGTSLRSALREGSSQAPPNLQHSDLAVTFIAQSSNKDAIYHFFLNLRESCLFEEVTSDPTEYLRTAQGRLISAKRFRVYVYSAEHIDRDK